MGLFLLFNFLLEYSRNLCLSTSKVKAGREAEAGGAVGCCSSFLLPKQEPLIPPCSRGRAYHCATPFSKPFPSQRGPLWLPFALPVCKTVQLQARANTVHDKVHNQFPSENVTVFTQRWVFRQIFISHPTQPEGNSCIQGCENESFLSFSNLAEILVNSELLVSPCVLCWAAEPVWLKAKHSEAVRAEGGWSTQSTCEESKVEAMGESLGLNPASVICMFILELG